MNKTLFLYWGGRSLSWLRYLTIKSFKAHNPDWEVVVYTPIQPTKGVNWTTGEQQFSYYGPDYTGLLDTEPFDARWVGLDNDAPEVHKSDLFRLWALHKYGGVYADFDIIFSRPLPEMSGFTFCLNDEHYAVGLIAADKGNAELAKLLGAGQDVSNNRKYQVYGSTLWNRTLKNPKGWNMPKELIYSTGWEDASDLFTKTKDLPDEAIGIHWYGGGVVGAEWESRLTPENYQDHPSTITQLIGRNEVLNYRPD